MDQELNSIALRAASGGLTLREAVREYERYIVTEALKVHSNNKQAVAKLLQISMSSLYRKLGEEPPVYDTGNAGMDTEYE